MTRPRSALSTLCLAGLALWFAVIVGTNIAEALFAMRLTAHAGFASGNLEAVRDVLTRIGIPPAGALLFFGLAIAVQAAAAAAFVAALVRPEMDRVNRAFTVAIFLFGAMVIFDEAARSYAMEAMHRDLIVCVAALFLVVRNADAQAR